MSLTVPPGTFVAKLTIGNKDYGEQRLNVLKDPYSAGSTGDIDSQTQFVTKLRDRCDGCIDLRFT
jgi:hypothetical protein